MAYEEVGGRALGDVCGYVFGMGDVGDCGEGLKCACVGACADPMIADYPSTCVEDTEPECPPLCRMYCENGYVKDENGCDTCECIPDEVEVCPEGCTSWFDGCNT